MCKSYERHLGRYLDEKFGDHQASVLNEKVCPTFGDQVRRESRNVRR